MSLTYNTSNLFGDKPKDKCDYSAETEFLFKLDNTLQTGKSIIIQETGGEHIACTNMKKIYMNFEKMRKLSGDSYFDFLIYVKGFNYHELSHILFTKYGKGSISYQHMNALNMLEDQRIEVMFSKKYSKGMSYFRLLSLGYILKDGLKAEHYPLLYGRRFIIGKSEIMSDLREMFVEQFSEQTAQEVEKIVDEYIITLDVKRQVELAIEMSNLLGSKAKSPMTQPYLPNRERKNSTNDEKEIVVSIGIDIQKGLEKIEKEQISPAKLSGKSDIQSDDNQSSDDQGEKKEDDEEGKDSDETDGNGKEENNDSEESDSNDDADLSEQLRDLVQETFKDVSEEIERQMQVMQKKSFNTEEIEFNDSNYVFNPESRHINTMKKLREQIKKMRNDLDNKTIYHQKKGKIDMRRAMINSDNYKVADFKRFVPSRLTKTKLAVSILLDSSGSMDNSQFETAVSSGWAIANALEDTGSKVKVYEFSHVHRIVKDFDDLSKNSKWGRNFCNSTNPLLALQDSEESLNHVAKRDNIANHMVMIITDGDFDRDVFAQVEALAKKLKDKGVFVVLINVGRYFSGNNKESYNKILHLRDFSQLTKSMTEMIKHIQLETVLKVKNLV